LITVSFTTMPLRSGVDDGIDLVAMQAFGQASV
jgi:hypothetical protein